MYRQAYRSLFCHTNKYSSMYPENHWLAVASTSRIQRQCKESSDMSGMYNKLYVCSLEEKLQTFILNTQQGNKIICAVPKFTNSFRCVRPRRLSCACDIGNYRGYISRPALYPLVVRSHQGGFGDGGWALVSFSRWAGRMSWHSLVSKSTPVWECGYMLFQDHI